MTHPHWIQQCLDLGIFFLDENGKVRKNEALDPNAVIGCARIVEKLRPELHKPIYSSMDQEAIVLARVLTQPSGVARELWKKLRAAVGTGHGDRIPRSLWSTSTFLAIAHEIDKVYLGESTTEVISSAILIDEYSRQDPSRRKVSLIDFNKTVFQLSDETTIESYGDPKSEWETAIDILRAARCRAIVEEASNNTAMALTGGVDVIKAVDYMSRTSIDVKKYLGGTINNKSSSRPIVDMLYGDEDGNIGMIDRIINAQEAHQPISTGIQDFDYDFEGGIPNPNGPFSYGRVFALGARTGTGKTIIGANVCASIAAQGFKSGFISIELDRQLIEARIWSALIYHLNKRGRLDVDGRLPDCGTLERPDPEDSEAISELLQRAGGALQSIGGNVELECPWGGDVDDICEIMRNMKSKVPTLTFICIDHFHCMQRHKGAAREEHLMLEDRAKKIMSCAKELQIDVLLLAQMNRSNLESKEDMTLGEIAGSDGLSHYCHAVFGVRKFPKERNMPSTNLELWHLKRRGGQYIWNDRTNRLDHLADNLTKGTIVMNYKLSVVEMPIPLGILKQKDKPSETEIIRDTCEFDGMDDQPDWQPF
jgi:hypothetical protein